jgi:hypothetical protein
MVPSRIEADRGKGVMSLDPRAFNGHAAPGGPSQEAAGLAPG